MENSPQVIFDEIWPMTLYYSTGCLARFWSSFKNSLKIQFCSESTQTFYTTYVHVYASEKFIKMENSLLAIFDEIWPMTLYYIVQGVWPDFGATLKFRKKIQF